MSNVRLKKGKKKEKKDTTAERGPERKPIPPLYSGGRHEPITLWPESPDTETEHRRALKRLLASTARRVPGNTASRSRERNTRYPGILLIHLLFWWAEAEPIAYFSMSSTPMFFSIAIAYASFDLC